MYSASVAKRICRSIFFRLKDSVLLSHFMILDKVSRGGEGTNRQTYGSFELVLPSKLLRGATSIWKMDCVKWDVHGESFYFIGSARGKFAGL